MGREQAKTHVAYLTSQYPTLSHTFILREVAAVRAAGLTVSTCSVRGGNGTQTLGEEEQAEQAATFYILAEARNPLRLLGAQLHAMVRPGRFFTALSLAFRTQRPGLKGFVWQIFYLLEAAILARHLLRIGADHLHCHFADSPCTVAMLTSALSGIPFSFTLHGPSDLMQPQSWHLGDKIRRADFVSCISHFARSQCMLHSDPQDWPKLRVVHCGVRPGLYRKRREPRADQTTELAFVGRLAPVKGLRVLIEALGAARESFPGLRLTIVGDGPDRAALEALSRPQGDAIRFTGPLKQADVAKLLATTDALVLPSFAEGVPVVLMEAMATGLPVIATRVAGVAELVTDGVSGRLVAPGDPEALREAVIEIARDADGRDRMGEAGRRMVEAEFDVDVEGRRIAALFLGEGGTGIRPDPRPIG
jgi:glycosyltransferase involved in cell wall biosynthesis